MLRRATTLAQHCGGTNRALSTNCRAWVRGTRAHVRRRPQGGQVNAAVAGVDGAPVRARAAALAGRRVRLIVTPGTDHCERVVQRVAGRAVHLPVANRAREV